MGKKKLLRSIFGLSDGRVSEFRRDLRASQPATWADVLCPEIPPRRGGFRQRRPCCLLPEPGSPLLRGEGRGQERWGDERSVCRGETTMVGPCLPPPWWGSRTQCSTPSAATSLLLLHGGLSAPVSRAAAVKGGRKLRRRAQQVPAGRGRRNSASASAHRGPCAPVAAPVAEMTPRPPTSPETPLPCALTMKIASSRCTSLPSIGLGSRPSADSIVAMLMAQQVTRGPPRPREEPNCQHGLALLTAAG